MKDEKEMLESLKSEALAGMNEVMPSIRTLSALHQCLGEKLREFTKECGVYREQYKRASCKLVELNGEVEKIPIGKHGQKQVVLSMEQVTRIAKDLGIEL